MVAFVILLAIATPSYTQFIRESRRDDAKHLLLLNSQRLHRCFTLQGKYSSDTKGSGSCYLREDSQNGYYTLSTSSDIQDKTFTLIAEPVTGTSQENDANCTSFQYDNTGRKTASGSDVESCW